MLQRQDVFASEFDVAFEASVEFANELAAIGSFRRDGVHVDGMTFGGWVEQPVKSLEIIRCACQAERRVSAARRGADRLPRPAPEVQDRAEACRGRTQPAWHLELRMPDRFRFGLIEIAGRARR